MSPTEHGTRPSSPRSRACAYLSRSWTTRSLPARSFSAAFRRATRATSSSAGGYPASPRQGVAPPRYVRRTALASCGAFTWLVTLDERVIGDCGTLGGVDDDGTIAIGYGLAAPQRRRGYGTALVPALTAWLLGQPEVRRVIASTEPSNRPSRTVLERAGFRSFSVTPTEVRYAFPPAPERW